MSMQAQEEVISRIQPVTERSRWLKAIIYGMPGVGKTTLCASAPSPIIIDVEKGTKSLLLDAHFQGVRILEPKEFKDVDSLFWAIRNGKIECESIILDSISEFQRLHLDEILIAENKKSSARNPYLAQQQDYRLSTEMMRRHVLALRELPLHFLMTAHAVETPDDVTGVPSIRPSVTPKLAGTLVGMMDLIGYYEIGDKQTRKLLCQPQRRIQAKNRIGLPAEIINPKWSDIVGVLQQEEPKNPTFTLSVSSTPEKGQQ